MATTSLHNDKRDAVAGRIEDKGARRRILLAGTIGTTIEWYDFFIYAFIAPLVFDQLFFPKYEQLTATLAVFATFAAGFLVRPLGGLVFGHFGDRVGRKSVLLCSLLMMGLATMLIGLLPTYGSAGLIATVALVVLRLLQGFALGGESTAANLMAIETAPSGRRVYAPTGTLQGPSGLASIGNPWWTIQPNLVFSYLKDGWNLTINVFDEINTANTRTDYRTGDIFHAEFTATKTIGKWTFGPVAYYVGQITNDRSSSFYGGAINVNRFDIWAAGGMVGYDFGPVTLNVWGTQELSSTASGGAAGAVGVDTAAITKGFSVFAQLSYRIWAPDSPATPAMPRLHK